MSLTHDPLPDDELVTAVLDGEATSDEVARVADSPGLAARLAAFETVARAVATPVIGLDDAEVDRLVRRAVAAGVSDLRTDDAATGAPTGGVADLAVRRRPKPTAGRWFAVAAAVVAVAAVPVALQQVVDDEPSEQFAAVGSAIDREPVGNESSKSADGAGIADDAATRSGGDAASSGQAAAPGVVADESAGFDLEEAAASTTVARPSADDTLEVAGSDEVAWMGDLGVVVDGPLLGPELALRSRSALPPGLTPFSDAGVPEDRQLSPRNHELLAAGLGCVRSYVGNDRVVAVGTAAVRYDTVAVSVLVAVVQPAEPDDAAPLRVVVVGPDANAEVCSPLSDAPLPDN